jgi:hypothetical protein
MTRQYSFEFLHGVQLQQLMGRKLNLKALLHSDAAARAPLRALPAREVSA